MIFFYFAFFFSCLIPFLSPFPLNTDVQPLFFLFSIFIFFANYKTASLTKIEAVFLFSSVVFILNFNVDNFPGYLYHLRKSVGLLLIFPVIWVASRYFGKLKLSCYLFVVIVLLIGALLQVFFASTYYAYGDLFFNNKVVHVGLRGWKSFTPEPINMAVTTIGIGILSYVSYLSGAIGKTGFRFIFICSFILAIGTLSATAIFIIAVLLVTYALGKLKPVTFLPILSVFSLLCFALPFFAEHFRPLHLFVTILQDPMYVISNSSLFYRVFHNVVAFLYFIDNPSFFGLGVASFNEAAVFVVENYDFSKLFYSRAEFLSDGLRAGFGAETKNMIAQLVIEHGLFGVFVYISFLSFIVLNWSKGLTKYVLVFFILTSIQSTPLVFPVTWVLLSANHFYCKRAKMKA